MSVTLVGTGGGDTGTMTLEVRQALQEADLIIGARRLLEGLPEDFGRQRAEAIYALEILN